MSRLKNCQLRGSIAWVVAAFAFASTSLAETVSGPALTDALRKGGYVLLMRHASSPRTPPKQANPDNKNAERQLDDEGRATAQQMGEAIRALKIPIGDVLSSPTYRALETVRYAKFGDPKTFAELGDAGRSMQSDDTGARAAWLREQLTKQPRAGTNTVIVTHLPNILEALGRDGSNLVDSETLVIKTGGEPAVIARVKGNEWGSLK